MSMTPAPLITGARTVSERTLLTLLALQLVGVAALFPYYAFARQPALGLRLFAGALAALALAAVVGVWRRAPWSLWAVVVVTSTKLVVDAFEYTLAPGLPNLPIKAIVAVSTLLNVAILALAFRRARPIGEHVTNGQRTFFASVLALAAWVALRGLFDPPHLAATIPFDVPPLHARFLGAMYLSGATFMALAIRAAAWRAVRIVVWMVAIWTGMLGLVSLLVLDAFDWGRAPTWTWFVAYSVFPIVAAWIGWRQRGVGGAGGDGAASGSAALDVFGANPLPAALRGYLVAQGVVVTLLALALLLAPTRMAALWPWKITPTLAQVYSAPFLSYGLGALMAARAKAMDDVRIALAATLVFAVAVLAASALHRALFAPAAPATWLWFGGFGVAAAALLRYVVASTRRIDHDANPRKA